MQNGISIYLGMDKSLDENLALLDAAHRHGIPRVFTSLQIPEADGAAVKKELGLFLQRVQSYGMESIADISPRTCKLLGIRRLDAKAFRLLGLSRLRLDDGFSTEEIIYFAQNREGIKLQLNASTLLGKDCVSELFALADATDRIDLLHNYYPRVGTGLDASLFDIAAYNLWHSGFPVGAFIPCTGKRGPFYDGLPTLEDHRHLPTDLAMRHLVALGLDFIFFGDDMPTEEELAALAALRNDCLTLRIRLETDDPNEIALLKESYTVRPDTARDAIRATESRAKAKDYPIARPEGDPKPRPRGAITIDNAGYGRYMGELQIIKNPSPPDSRINVVAHLLPEEEFLLDYLLPSSKFSFQFQG